MDGNFVRRAARRLSTVAALSVMLSAPAAAQQQATGTIRGQVTDAVTMRPLSGVQVSVPGTGRGGLANTSGQFLILNVPAGTFTVKAEMIGYATQEVQVTVAAGQVATADFKLSQSAMELDAIVVTGTPGQTQKRALGNSVSQFDASAVTNNVPVPNVQQMLQGRTPGLTLLSSGGGVGDGSHIQLRGAGSLNAGVEPVVYVDGVRIESGNQNDGSCGSSTHCTSALDFLNPDDIATIEVIKGPAASTLYGAEAAAGVIQIITKKGRAGAGVQWTASMDAGTSAWALPRPTTYWYCTPSNVASSSYPGCTSEGMRVYHPLDDNPNAMRGNAGSDDPNGAGRYGMNLSASGGGDLFKFFLSTDKSDEQGVFLNNYSRRLGGRANFSFTPSEKMNFSVNFGYARTHVRAPLSNNSSNSILRNGMRGRADAAYQYEVGYRNFGPTLANEWDVENRTERYTVGMTANYTPFKWFTNRLILGLDAQDRRISDFTGLDQTGNAPWGTTRATGYTDIELRPVHNWTLDYSGTINSDINENVNSALSAGMQLNSHKSELYGVTGEGLVTNTLNLVSSAAVNRGSQSFSEQTSLGFYVQEMVGWKNRLFGTAAVRVDDNSAFGNNFSLVVYPKAQLSYVISDEDWFDYSFIDQLKLRGAWGQAGNPPDPFTADRTYTADVTTVGDAVVNMLRQSSYGNSDLKAETGSEVELGFESSLFDGRMGLDFTYYRQNTKDALIGVPDPPSSGFNGTHYINVGSIKNDGLELMLTATPIYTRAVQWDASIALSRNHNELVSWGDAPLTEISFGEFATVQKHIPGYSMGGFWSTDVVRDASGSPVLDASGDVTVATDQEYVGPALPTREIGFTNTFTIFDNFRVFANLDYKGGNYQWCAICSIRSRIDLNTLLVNDPNSDPTEVKVVQSLQTKTWIKPADFIKLRELSVTYQLPSSVAGAMRFSSASFTLSGRNLWMWTKYKFDQEGLSSPDPEVQFNSLSAFGRTDYAAIPMLRTFAASMRFTF